MGLARGGGGGGGGGFWEVGGGMGPPVGPGFGGGKESGPPKN